MTDFIATATQRRKMELQALWLASAAKQLATLFQTNTTYEEIHTRTEGLHHIMSALELALLDIKKQRT